MDKTYQPEHIEERWYNAWEKAGYFRPQGNPKRPYCMMIPPPNVTGTLHMGHGFQYTLMDVLARYHRMQGDHTLWQVGTDHAGIATQLVVERQLAAENQTRHTLGREAFVKRVWQWKQHSGHTMTQQMRRLGNSVDWERERFTMDPALSKAVQTVFIRLYRDGLIYRGKRLVNWDVQLGSAISDLEVTNTLEEGLLWHIQFPLVGEKGGMTIATTRPETLLGDTALAVHPEDSRYQAMIGKRVHVPLTDRTIPILADTYVDPTFGSGCVKITPAHDFNDYQVGLRHDLPMIQILTPKGQLNDQVPPIYRGLNVQKARQNIVNDLKTHGFLIRIDPHKHQVPRSSRTQAIIEPYLTDQWFIKMKPLAIPAITALKDGRLNVQPQRWANTYRQWLEQIEDWCISRQLWWGHRIPAWYDDADNIYVGTDEADVRSHYQLSDQHPLTQDADVLDTWFSSALWPFATLGWPEQTPDLRTFYPTQTLVTGFDIIFFWVARMVMMGLYLTQKVPFHTVYITGLIRDQNGQKMSKSKGNTIDPIDLIDGISYEALLAKRIQAIPLKHAPTLKEQITQATRKQFPNGIPQSSVDALRFTFCSLAGHGRDIQFDIARLTGYRNFCNKLWNAARYVLAQLPKPVDANYDHHPTAHLLHQWIQTRTQETIKIVHQALDQYRFDWAAKALYETVWHDYCDWYLECSKLLLKDANAIEQTRYTLVSVLDTLLRLLHPIIPFITEEIWQHLKPYLPPNATHLQTKNGDHDRANQQEMLMMQSYPIFQATQCHQTASQTFAWLQRIITAIRTLRSTCNIDPHQSVSLQLKQGTAREQQHIQTHQAMIVGLAKLNCITWLDDQTPPSGATTVIGTLQLAIPLEGLVDPNVEHKRLDHQIKKLVKSIDACKKRLENPHYRQKAPSDVVASEQKKLVQLKHTYDKLCAARAAMASLSTTQTGRSH